MCLREQEERERERERKKVVVSTCRLVMVLKGALNVKEMYISPELPARLNQKAFVNAVLCRGERVGGWVGGCWGHAVIPC